MTNTHTHSMTCRFTYAYTRMHAATKKLVQTGGHSSRKKEIKRVRVNTRKARVDLRQEISSMNRDKRG